MARFPAFEDYEQRGNYHDGVERCDELLEKNPNTFQLLLIKYRLINATHQFRPNDEANAVLDQIIAALPIQDLPGLIALEEAVAEPQVYLYPCPSTLGPAVTKVWDAAFKSITDMNQKLEAISIRFQRAIVNNRLVDAQQALIQLKAALPKNRVVYLAHAAFTQLISQSNDDLQARLAIGLARKAVTEKFDEDGSLDCRVPGQIFALQGSEKEVEGVKGRRFGESKQVFDVLRKKRKVEVNGDAAARSVLDFATVPANEWLACEINSLKTQFAFLMEANANTSAIRSFATNAIHLFHQSIASLSTGARRSPADACFLAISALVRLFELTNSNTHYLLHAAHLAETLLTSSPHIHEARLILVYIYMRLNLGSLAMKLFDSLGVTEIQHDTVGHVLYTRLSLIHPSATSWEKKEGLDPLKQLAHALGMYVRHEDKLAETLARVLASGQTGMIFDLQELRDSLRMSLARRITLLEQRRAARLRTGSVGVDDEAARAMGPLVTENWVQVSDNRDFDATFTYGYKVEKVLQCPDGTPIGKAWVLYSLAADCASCFASGSTSLVHDPEAVLEGLRKIKADVDLSSLSVKDAASALGVASAEFMAGELACRVLAFLLLVNSGEGSEKKLKHSLASCLTAVETLSIDSLITTPDPLAERLLDHYAYLDVLRITIAACKYAHDQAQTLLSEQLQELEGLAEQSVKLLQGHAAEQQVRCTAPKVRQLMTEDEEVWKAILPLDVEVLDRFCGDAASSATEGWEGIGRIKLV